MPPAQKIERLRMRKSQLTYREVLSERFARDDRLRHKRSLHEQCSPSQFADHRDLAHAPSSTADAS
jgi:hypothetical protein